MNKGLAIHYHHDILIEYCYDYRKRVKNIKEQKPVSEQKLRLRLFKILPDEALKDLPMRLQKAYAEWQKAYAEWQKANAERKKADAEWRKADAEWQKAYAEWGKAYAEWEKVDRDAFHKKWCGCKKWNGKEIIFTQEKG